MHNTAGNPDISWPMERPASSHSNGNAVSAITGSPGWRPARPVSTSNGNAHAHAQIASSTSTSQPALDLSNYPDGDKSLAGISLRAHILGIALGIFTSIALYLSALSPTTYDPLWRIPFFLASLSLFHFLEYYITARYNTRFADISAFLLSSNGWAYNVAHMSAVLECLLSHTLLDASTSISPSFFARIWRWSELTPGPIVINNQPMNVQVIAGLLLMVVGQTIRTIAMGQAGSNFNHTVQVERKQGHTLVTNGLYSVLRHPSYFGFFWWGVGTQLVLGNVICLAAYTVVLWRFFHSRIDREERFLVSFFGDEYVAYRKRASVGIPFIH